MELKYKLNESYPINKLEHYTMEVFKIHVFFVHILYKLSGKSKVVLT